MKFWFLFFFAGAYATVNEPFRWEVFSGYRNDHLHWHLQTGGSGLLNTSARYRDVQFWENGVDVHTVYRDLVFFLRASYAAFGKGGTLFERYANLSFASNDPEFSFNTNGWAADTSGYFGYAVNLTPDRTYKVLLVPLFGYSAHFEHLRASDSRPDPLQSPDAIGASFYRMSSFVPGSLHSTWFGALLGAGFKIEPGGNLIFSGGYSYHWLQVRLKSQYKTRVVLFNPAPGSIQENAFSFQVKGSGNLGQTGWGQIDFVISRWWQTGLGAQIHYYSTGLLDTRLHETSSLLASNTALDQKLKNRWTSIAGWFIMSRKL